VAAALSLPEEVPAFLRRGRAALATYASDPDLFKNRRTPHLQRVESPDHYIDLEYFEGIELPEGRRNFERLCSEMGLDPYRTGTLPYAIHEHTDRLTIAFALWRAGPSPSAEARVLYWAGVLSHYSTDAANPLHLTIHHNGRAREDGTSPRSGIHNRMDGLPEYLAADSESLAALVEPAPLANTFRQTVARLVRWHDRVEEVYRLEPLLPPGQPGRRWEAPEIIREYGDRLMADAVDLTASLWLTAWERSAAIDLPSWAEPPPGRPVPREVVITLDDLPVTPGTPALEDVARINEGVLSALVAHDVPAVGFVTAENTDPPRQREARTALLRRWAAAGMELGNHSYSHPAFHELTLEAYLEDVLRGETLPRSLMGEGPSGPFYFRHPYNSAGGDSLKRAAFDSIMAARGVTIAPFTVENSDYIYDRLWLRASAAADAAQLQRVEQAYLDHTARVFDYFEGLALDTFGRDIPQVLLIHDNAINAAMLARLLTMLEARGYRFVSLAEAMDDPAYASPNPYHDRWGLSWLHRWRRGLGLEDRLREEPDPPEWVMEAYQRRR
jgi:peptidoglycan/xylan/chitin deacetylase (PgdA/CDA1 family)